jgi:hypothetical protein
MSRFARFAQRGPASTAVGFRTTFSMMEEKHAYSVLFFHHGRNSAWRQVFRLPR